MSSVYISDMEMPPTPEKGGAYMDYRIWNDGTVEALIGPAERPYRAMGLSDHGRLVDENELLQNLLLDDSTSVIATSKRINEYIALKLEEAVTIIPEDHIGDGTKMV